MEDRTDLYRLLAGILDYPAQDLPEQVEECSALLSKIDPEAAVGMEQFRAFLEATPQGRLEEIYSGTFDLQVVCYPYAGYHLFGESYKRGEFLAKLKEHYSAANFSSGSELPDHISVLLRYLAELLDNEERRVIISECLIPAVSRMTEHLKDGNPYRDIFQTLLMILRTPQAMGIRRDQP